MSWRRRIGRRWRIIGLRRLGGYRCLCGYRHLGRRRFWNLRAFDVREVELAVPNVVDLGGRVDRYHVG
jgi:hypothetical protein